MTTFSTSLVSRWTLLAAIGLLTLACGGGGESDGGGAQDAPPPPPGPQADVAPPTAAATLGSSTVAGKVVFDGQAPRLKPVSMDADPGCAAKHDGPVAPESLVLGEDQSLGNVFVQVTNAPAGTYPPPAEAAVVDQNGCLYEPHVLGILAGQTLLFRNSDGLLHNVHGLPKENREFNMGMPPAVTESEMTLKRPEPVFPIKCDVHPWMRTYVAVMAHPFFAVTDTSGEFQIEGLPAGAYDVEAWHEKLGTHTASVTVGDGETGTADFTFTVPDRR